MDIKKIRTLLSYKLPNNLILKILFFIFFSFLSIAGTHDIKNNLLSRDQKQTQPVVVVKGKVTDEKGAPLAGAVILIRERARTVVTDTNGEFTIGTLLKENLEFSFPGFKSKTVKVSEKTLNVKLKKE